MNIKILVDKTNSYYDYIGDMLSAYNVAYNAYFKFIEDPYEKETHNLILYDNGKPIGGAIGFKQYKWYYLDLLCLEPNYRGLGLGTKIIDTLKKQMKDKCIGIRLETWDFQAIEFYKRCGFKAFGELRDCPKGTTTYFLEFRLDNTKGEK